MTAWKDFIRKGGDELLEVRAVRDPVGWRAGVRVGRKDYQLELVLCVFGKKVERTTRFVREPFRWLGTLLPQPLDRSLRRGLDWIEGVKDTRWHVRLN